MRRRRPRLEVRDEPGLTLTGTVNPDFGQVEADPAVVNLSAFETFFAERRPFFVEGSGIFRFDTDCNDGVVQRAVLLAAHRPRSRAASRRFPKAATRRAGADDDPRRREADRADRRLLCRCAQRGDRRRGRHHRRRPAAHPSDRRAAVELLGGPRAPRVRRTSRRSASSPPPPTATWTTTTRFLPGQAYTGGVGLGLAAGQAVRDPGLLGGQHRARRRRGDRRAAGEQRPQLPASGRRRTSRRIRRGPRSNGYGGADRAQQDRRPARAVQHQRRLQEPRASTSTTSASCGAPTRATMSNWMQWRHDKPNKYLRSFRFNLNQWAGLELRRRSPQPGRQRQRARGVRQQLGDRNGRQRQPQTFDDRATRGGPGAYRNSQRSVWAYLSSDERRRVGGRPQHLPRDRRPRH